MAVPQNVKPASIGLRLSAYDQFPNPILLSFVLPSAIASVRACQSAPAHSNGPTHIDPRQWQDVANWLAAIAWSFRLALLNPPYTIEELKRGIEAALVPANRNT